MQWAGKVIGGVLGAIGLGPVGAALGALLGHQYDVRSDEGSRRNGGPAAGSANPQVISAVFFRAAFAAMGYVAKADGRVSEREIQAARSVMQQMHLTPDQVQAAIRFFSEGKQPGFPLERTLKELRETCGDRHDLLRVFVEIQLRAALEGSDMAGPARSLVQSIAQRLGFSPLEVAHLEAVLRIQRSRQQQAGAQRARSTALGEAYELLEVAATAPDEEVIKAYRRQMSRHHPDKLVANGLPESMMELAKEKTQQIREAYEIIREHRGI